MTRRKGLTLSVLAIGLFSVSYLTNSVCSGGSCLSFLPLAAAASAPNAANTNTLKQTLAPQWELKNVDGKPIRLSDFKNKIVILNFWATWCPPCRREIPALVGLQKQYQDKGLVVVGVALDEGGAAVVKPFVKKVGITYPIVIGDDKTTAAYGGIGIVPTTFIIDKTGKIASQLQGGADRTEFEAKVKPLLSR